MFRRVFCRDGFISKQTARTARETPVQSNRHRSWLNHIGMIQDGHNGGVPQRVCDLLSKLRNAEHADGDDAGAVHGQSLRDTLLVDLQVKVKSHAYSLQNIMQNVKKNATKIARQLDILSTRFRLLRRIKAYSSHSVLNST